MDRLYLSDNAVVAIKAIDSRDLEYYIEQALDGARASLLSGSGIRYAHPAITRHLGKFERDLEKLAQAKSDARRKEMWRSAWDSGDDLKHIVSSLKQRVAEQEAETQLLVIDDQILPPPRFQQRVEVDVHFRWRATPASAWSIGAICFFQDVDMRPNYLAPQPKRKPSATKQDVQRQETLSKHWESLRMLALHAVRDYLMTGGDGRAIPKSFEAKPTQGDRFLNNFSCNFWESLGEPRERPRPEPRAFVAPSPVPDRVSDTTTPDGAISLDARVIHRVFGVGTVVHIEGNKVTADFGDRGSKRVVADFLEPVRAEDADPA